MRARSGATSPGNRHADGLRVRPRAGAGGTGALRLLVDSLDGFMWQADPATLRLQFVTPGAEELLGYPIEELLIGPELWRSIVHPDDRDRVIQSLRATASNGRDGEIEFRARSANGATLSLHQVVRLLEAESGAMELWGLTTDVTADARAAEERASNDKRYRALSAQAAEFRRQAMQDALTGLPNRLLLEDRLRIALETAQRAGASCALLLMDLDRFKEINDTRGHQAGDEVLRQVALRLRIAVRAQDSPARLGGDEFAAVLPNTDTEGAIRAAQRIIRALDTPIEVEGSECDVGASIGIALFPLDGAESAELMNHADQAMYRAKRAGGGYALFSRTGEVAVVRTTRRYAGRGWAHAGRALLVIAATLGISSVGVLLPVSTAPPSPGAAGRLDAAAVALARASDERFGDVVGTVETTIAEIPWKDVTEGDVISALRKLGVLLTDLRSEVATPLRDRVEQLIDTIQRAESVARIAREEVPAPVVPDAPDVPRRDPRLPEQVPAEVQNPGSTPASSR